MTEPRFWTDPLAGLNYGQGKRLLSTEQNAHLAAARNLDLALERSTLLNWPHRVTGLAQNIDDLTLDPSLGRYVAAGDTGANPVAYWSNNAQVFNTPGTPPPAGAGLTAVVVTTDGAGVFVMGGTPGGASAVKVRRSAGGGVWTVQSTTAAGAEGIVAITWDPINSLFIAGMDGGTTTTALETSPNGTAWTTRNMPDVGAGVSNHINSIASNGTDLIVAIGNLAAPAATDKCATSPDGVTWTARTMASAKTWIGVAYCAKQAKWLALATDGTIDTSTDGITWANVAAPTFPDGAPTFGTSSLTATENYFVAVGHAVNIGGNPFAMVMASDDAGATWENVGSLGAGAGASRIQYKGGQLLATAVADTTVYASARYTYT
jgi:hypothetical protein